MSVLTVKELFGHWGTFVSPDHDQEADDQDKLDFITFLATSGLDQNVLDLLRDRCESLADFGDFLTSVCLEYGAETSVNDYNVSSWLKEFGFAFVGTDCNRGVEPEPEPGEEEFLAQLAATYGTHGEDSEPWGKEFITQVIEACGEDMDLSVEVLENLALLASTGKEITTALILSEVKAHKQQKEGA